MNTINKPGLQSVDVRAFNVESKATTKPTPAVGKAIAEKAAAEALANKSATKAATEATIKAKQDNVKAAIAEMSEYTQSIQRDIQFAIDNELGRTVVSVIDRETKEVIRQIPDESFLELARALKESLAADEGQSFHFMSAKA